MLFPSFKRSPRTYIPLSDWILGLIAAFCAAYLFLFYKELALRPGQPDAASGCGGDGDRPALRERVALSVCR